MILAVYKIKPFLVFSSVAIIMILLLRFPAYAAEGIRKGLVYSVELLVPSLFPFMVLSSFIMRSGVSDFVGKVFGFFSKKFLNLPESCASAVILSLIGGFPVGAKCISILSENRQINFRQAERMSYFCVCSGPAFLITAVGTLMLHNSVCGVILYFSQVISALLIGILTGIFSEKSDDSFERKMKSPKENLISDFLLSCRDGANSIIEMTALVILFSMIINMISYTGFSDNIILPIFLEVTSANKILSENGAALWLFSFAAGFGGLCVHLQILNILKEIKINYRKFVFFRLVNAGISSVITFLICQIYQPVQETFSVFGGAESEISSGTAAGTVAILILSVIFLLTIRKNFLILSQNR